MNRIPSPKRVQKTRSVSSHCVSIKITIEGFTFHIKLIKVSLPDVHSFDDFPPFTPYSDIKKNKSKFGVVSKSSWQSIRYMKKKNWENQHVSDIRISKDVKKKHLLVQECLEGQSTLVRKKKSSIDDPVSEVLGAKNEQAVNAVSI